MTRWIKCPNPICQGRCEEMKDPKYNGVFYCEQCNIYMSKKGFMGLDLKKHNWGKWKPFDNIKIYDSCE